jgi:hypothetical protein
MLGDIFTHLLVFCMPSIGKCLFNSLPVFFPFTLDLSQNTCLSLKSVFKIYLFLIDFVNFLHILGNLLSIRYTICKCVLPRLRLPLRSTEHFLCNADFLVPRSPPFLFLLLLAMHLVSSPRNHAETSGKGMKVKNRRWLPGHGTGGWENGGWEDGGTGM